MDELPDLSDDRRSELAAMGLVKLPSSNTGVSIQLTAEGAIQAEQLLYPWWLKLWLNHQPAIITGAFSIIAAVLGGIVGGAFVLLAS